MAHTVLSLLKRMWTWMMSLLDNVRDVAFSSSLEVDKIIGTYEGSFTLSSPSAGNTNTETVAITTNIPETTFFQGIWSKDGGTTWNSFSTRIEHVERTSAAVNPQGESYVWGKSESNKFTVIGENTANFSATQLYNLTISYKVALIAKPNQGDITPQPIGSNVWFDSRNNYQKIATDNIQATSGLNQTVTVNHGLGYVPVVRVFREAAGVLELLETKVSSVSFIKVTTSSVTTSISGSFTGSIYTRVYYDE